VILCRARGNLDRHATYIGAAYVADGKQKQRALTAERRGDLDAAAATCGAWDVRRGHGRLA
jgi:hypothetical protein